MSKKKSRITNPTCEKHKTSDKNRNQQVRKRAWRRWDTQDFQVDNRWTDHDCEEHRQGGGIQCFKLHTSLSILQCRRLWCSRYIGWRTNLDRMLSQIVPLPFCTYHEWWQLTLTNMYILCTSCVHLAGNRITLLVWKNVTMTFHHG